MSGNHHCRHNSDTDNFVYNDQASATPWGDRTEAVPMGALICTVVALMFVAAAFANHSGVAFTPG